MLKNFFFVVFSGLPFFLIAQNTHQALAAAVHKLETDPQFIHAIISLYVVDERTGKVVFEKNSQVGLAPASCQKLVTSVSAFELLGNKFQYNTPFKIYKEPGTTRLFIEGSGDPTIGSWRWESTGMNNIYKNIQSALVKNKIVSCDVSVIKNKFSYQPIPDGWVWQDIGNYYGAGAWAFNWHENQYGLLLSSGNIEGDSTHIKGFEPLAAQMPVSNFIVTGKKGSGDNAYIYAAPYNNIAFTTGTIPPSQNKFIISGAMPDPSKVFIKGLRSYLDINGIEISEGNDTALATNKNPTAFETIYNIISPSLDSINYWFLKKSINLYGEALVKTISYETTGSASTDTGIAIIKDLWSKKGIERSAVNIIDGSGLSPANRITTNALVRIMQYAKDQPWFNSFKNALPEINSIKMKDGYIGGVRSYTGYVTGKSGTSYTFSFIVNNFTGDPANVREKMWQVLDILK